MFTITITSGEAQLLVQDSGVEAQRQFASGEDTVSASVPQTAWARVRPVEGSASVTVTAGSALVRWKADNQQGSLFEPVFIEPGETAQMQIEWPLWAVIECLDG